MALRCSNQRRACSKQWQQHDGDPRMHHMNRTVLDVSSIIMMISE